jgi:hypothetical protein
MRFSRGLVVLGLAVSLATAPAAPAAAKVEPLVITPPVAELSIDPGRAVTETVNVTNNTGARAHIVAAVGDVIPSDDGGFTIRPASSTPESAASWVSTSPSSVDVEAGASALVTLSIRAPAAEPVGGHYAGVLFSIEGGPDALHTMLIEVTGPGIVRSAKLLGLSMPRVEINGRVPFKIQVQNTGNTFVGFQGTISIHDRLRKSDTTISFRRFYALPGRTATITISWLNPPPIVWARATANVTTTFAGGAVGDRADARATGLIIIWWAVAIVVALVLIVLRLLTGLFGRRRREDRRARHERRMAARAAEEAARRPAAAAELPAPLGGPPRRSAWDEHAHSPTAGAIALRRARAALRMLRAGAGESGVRVDVAIGLLRSVEDIPEVLGEVEGAYADAVRRRATKEAAALSLALMVVDSVEAPEALLRAYARADRVLAARLRKALTACDPADLRAHHELLDALPPNRRQTLPGP